MLDLLKLIQSAQACLGWPYVSPGTNDERGIDCSGLFVKMYRDQGATIYHGSNTIYRKYCSSKGKLTNVNQLKQGYAVFKHKDADTEKYQDGLGDFCHIGIVESVNPLRIIHASSDAGKVTTDTKLGKWKYWGKLKDVLYPDGTTIYDPAQLEKDDEPETSVSATDDDFPKEEEITAETVTVWSENGLPVKMRRKPTTSCNQWIRIPVGSELTLDKYNAHTDKNGEQWSQVSSGWRTGWYMMSKFLTFG